MISSKSRNRLGITLGAVGSFSVAFALCGTALVARKGQGMETFTPYVFLLGLVAFVSSMIVVGQRVTLFAAMSVTYALIPVMLLLGSRSWWLLHSFCGLVAIVGIVLGAAVQRGIRSHADRPDP